MVASALVVGTASDFFAHDSVQMPFSSVLFGAFNHRFEFGQELDVFFVFLEAPMRSRKGLSRRLLSLEAKHNLFGTIDPGLEFFQRCRSLESKSIMFGVNKNLGI